MYCGNIIEWLFKKHSASTSRKVSLHFDCISELGVTGLQLPIKCVICSSKFKTVDLAGMSGEGEGNDRKEIWLIRRFGEERPSPFGNDLELSTIHMLKELRAIV
jgi:hypothetical protein